MVYTPVSLPRSPTSKSPTVLYLSILLLLSLMPSRVTVVAFTAPSVTGGRASTPAAALVNQQQHNNKPLCLGPNNPARTAAATTTHLYSKQQGHPSVDDDDDDDESKEQRRSWQKGASAALLSTLVLPSMAAHAAALPNAPAMFSSVSQTGFYQAFSLVFLSEIGDKTFFIAGLLAMKTSRWISFVGSIAALAVMTVLSVLIGQIFHAVPSGIADGIPLDDICAVAAFLFFGLKTLSDALSMDESSVSVMDEELQEAKETVQETETVNRNSLSQIATIFALVFAAELGDRSFLSTIALSAAQAPVAVALGAVAAHAVATGIAVASGSVVAKYLSERVIGIIGGSLFLVFAATTAIGIF